MMTHSLSCRAPETPPEEQAARELRRLFPARRVARVLLLNPPDADAELFRFDTARRGRYTNYPPYGLISLAAHLQDEGVEVRVLNLNHVVLKACFEAPCAEAFAFDAGWQDALDQAVANFRPDLIGVTAMFTMGHAAFRQICRRAATFGVPLIVGGVHVSNDVERVLDDVGGIDLAITGEGEVALTNLVRVIRGDAPATDLAQLVVAPRNGGARIRIARQCRPGVEVIDRIPAYDTAEVADLSRYGVIGAFYCFKPKDTLFATVLSNRGCRGQCTFCSVRNFNGAGVRHRSVTSVVDEIELLRDRYGIGHVMWLDDDLFKDHGRAVALFNEMTRRNLGVTWDATNGVLATSCTEEVIAAAAASGCIAVNMGMESGNPEILRRVKKPGTVDSFLRAAEVLRRYEAIHASVFLMVGFPGETMRMIQDTIDVARQMDLDWYRISQLQPLPNTPIYDAMVVQGLIQPVGSKDLRFNGGAYGKQTLIEQGLAMATPDFGQAFAGLSPDDVPSGEQLTDIWFFMNYHLNFHRIFHEIRPEKVRQLTAHLQVLGDVISPENGFALYFQGVLQHRREGAVEPGLIERLHRRLATSVYWADRFRAFGLAADDLAQGVFPMQDAPRMVFGRR